MKKYIIIILAVFTILVISVGCKTGTVEEPGKVETVQEEAEGPDPEFDVNGEADQGRPGQDEEDEEAGPEGEASYDEGVIADTVLGFISS